MVKKMLAVLAGALVLATGGTAGAVSAAARRDGHDRHEGNGHAEEPLVIAHRGASAIRPEHTLLAYEAAIRLGADYIEPDLVSTKDGVLVARHENEIGGTTDVAAHLEFAGRRTTKTIDGVSVTGWFTEDFTLAELRTLRARERVPDLRPGNTAFDGLAPVPTFDEVVELARRHGVGVYPETKHPTYFASIGLPLEEPLLRTLRHHGWDGPDAPVFVQSFETGNLKRLRPRTRLRLIQLIRGTGAPYDLVASGDPRTYDDLVTPRGLRDIARYADGVGVATTRLIRAGRDGRLREPTSLVRDAHREGLLVHTWPVRPENSQLPPAYRAGDPASPVFPRATGQVADWLERLYRLGVDGVFSDDPGIAIAVREHVSGD